VTLRVRAHLSIEGHVLLYHTGPDVNPNVSHGLTLPHAQELVRRLEKDVADHEARGEGLLIVVLNTPDRTQDLTIMPLEDWKDFVDELNEVINHFA
jgi:hypothetical protein